MNREEIINNIIEIGSRENIKIVFSGDDNIIYFSVEDYQPVFNFNIQICYSGIKSKQCFYLNIPSINLYQKDLEKFIKSINKAKEIINDLNSLIDMLE